MKWKIAIIFFIACLCISSNINAKCILTHGNGLDIGVKRLDESIDQTNHANDLLSDRYLEKEYVKDLKYEHKIESKPIVNDSEPIVNDSKPSEPETIVIYGYPSAWNNNMVYRKYKIIYDIKIFDNYLLNIKPGIPEGEWTDKNTDQDFDLVSGNEKWYGSCYNPISKYIMEVQNG